MKRAAFVFCAVTLLLSPGTSVIGVLDGTARADKAPAAADINTAPFTNITRDPRPKSITRNAHYVISNESHPWLFQPALEAANGGVMVGVGADQMYVYAGWSKPQVLIPMDFDQVIVDLHFVYGAFYKQATTPQALIDMWSGKKATMKAARALLSEAYKADPKHVKRVLQAYRLGQRLVHGRLNRLVKMMKKNKTAFFLNDQAQFDHIRKLWVQGRVFPIRGDLTADLAMASIAKAAKDAGLPIRALYMSNAEQYFNWTKNFRSNIAGLPFDDKSTIVRTFPDGQRSYYYYVQNGKNFQRWVASPRYRKTFGMLRFYRTKGKHPRFYTVEKEPKPPKEKK